MRLGLIIYGSLDVLSGGYLYDRIMVEHLQQHGHSVEIFALPWRNYASHLTDNFDNAFLRRLIDAPLDVLVQDELNHPSLFWLNHRLKPHVRYPIVSIVHLLRSSEARPAWQQALYRTSERAYLRTVDGFVYISQTTRRLVETLIGAALPSVVAYPAGDHLSSPLPEEQIIQRVRSGGPLRVIYVGNIMRRKGLHTLLDALARLPASIWHLTAAGGFGVEPAYVAAIRAQIERLGLGESVSLVGPIRGQALSDALSQSDVFAMPSSQEGLAIVYLEALAHGLPVLGTAAGATYEVITDSREGFLIPPDDTALLANRLQRLASDRELLLTMSLSARRRFDAHPTWQQSAELVQEFLHSMASH